MRYSVIPIILILSLLFVSNCFADETALRYKIGYQVEDGGFHRYAIVTGLDGAGKGFDGEGMWENLPSSGILLSIRRVQGSDDWNGNTGWYASDSREKLSPGQSIIVDGIYLWATPGTPSQDMHLRLTETPFLEPGVSFSLSLVSIPQGVEYSGPRTWGPETSEIVLPFCNTDNGETGYKFRLTISADQ